MFFVNKKLNRIEVKVAEQWGPEGAPSERVALNEP